MKGNNKGTRNLVVVTTNFISSRTTFQSEPISNLKAYRVLSLSLNLDSLSPAIPMGLGLPNVIYVFSATFASLTGNSWSFIDGKRKELIAAYPVNLRRATTVGTRTTWEFNTEQKQTILLNPLNINRYDLSVYIDNTFLQLGPTDTYTVILETECELEAQ